MKSTLMTLAALALVSGAALAQDGKPAPAAKKAYCPIMKHDFVAKASSPTSKYKGKTYTFCCAGCKPEFEKNPAKYAAATPKKPAAKPGKKSPKKPS